MEWPKKFRFGSKSFYKKNYTWKGLKTWKKETGFVKNNKKTFML